MLPSPSLDRAGRRSILFVGNGPAEGGGQGLHPQVLDGPLDDKHDSDKRKVRYQADGDGRKACPNAGVSGAMTAFFVGSLPL